MMTLYSVHQHESAKNEVNIWGLGQVPFLNSALIIVVSQVIVRGNPQSFLSSGAIHFHDSIRNVYNNSISCQSLFDNWCSGCYISVHWDYFQIHFIP